MYKLRYCSSEETGGAFYPHELHQVVKTNDVYEIDTIVIEQGYGLINNTTCTGKDIQIL